MTPVWLGPQSFPEENRFVGDFVSEIVFGAPGRLEKYCTMAVLESGRLVAGTVYHNWDRQAGVIELTSGSTTKRWLTRRVVQAMFHLPFGMLGCQMVVLRVPERNAGMAGIARRFGFEETFIPRLFGRDVGGFIFTLTDDAWAASRFNRQG